MSDNPNVYQGQLGTARPNDVAISADGSLIYAAGDDGYLRAYSAATGALVSEWDIGTRLGGMDISPDGTFALVLERVPVDTYVNQYGEIANIVTVHKVNLLTGAVTNFDYRDQGQEYAFFDVAVLNDGTALLTLSVDPRYYLNGWIEPKILNISTGVYSGTGITVANDSILVDSSTGSSALISEANYSGGYTWVYQPGSGFSWTGYGDATAGTMAFSDVLGLYAQYGFSSGIRIYQTASGEVISLAELYPNWNSGGVSGLAFDATGEHLFVLDNNTDTIVQLSTVDWSIVAEFVVGADLSSWGGNYANRLLVGPNASYFTVVTEDGLVAVDPTAPPPPSENADTLFGTPEADLIDGLGGDDLIKGLGGDDIISGSAGSDRLFGGEGADSLSGGDSEDQIFGDAGNDVLNGDGADDVLAGGLGADTLNGGAGDDILYSVTEPDWWGAPVEANGGVEVDTLIGGGGDDLIYAGFGDSVDGGVDRFGGEGDQLFITFQGATSGITFDFSLDTQVIGGGTITNVERIGWVQGSEQDDYISLCSNRPGGEYDAPSVMGMGGNDTLIGDAKTSLLDGGDGDDTLDGRAAGVSQNILGGSGNDVLYSGDVAISYADGGDGNDTIYAFGYAYGGSGDDVIILRASQDLIPAINQTVVDGGSGDDQITGAVGADAIKGGQGADSIDGGDGNDYLFSDDVTYGWEYQPVSMDFGSERDVLVGGAGDDSFAIGFGDDADGGVGTDVLRLNLAGASSGVTLDTRLLISEQGVVIGGGSIRGMEVIDHLRASDFADVVTIGAGGVPTSMDLGAGDDHLTVLAGVFVDYADLGDGNDTIITTEGSYYIDGGYGNDLFISGAGSDQFDGSADFDTVDYQNSSVAVAVELLEYWETTTGPSGDILRNIEGLSGSAFGDTLTGNSIDNVLSGSAGNDTLNGGLGNDTLDGGTGSDTLRGGSGNDIYILDVSSDVVTEASGGGTDEVRVAFNYTLGSNLESASALGTAAVSLTGNGLNNVLKGNGAANSLIGLGGNDVLDGGAGNDSMRGGTGNDTYFADSASDVVVEISGEGTDLVRASVSYTLASNVENALADGTAAINLIGNTTANMLTGNSAANVLNGGLGNDTLKGDAGDDTLEGAGGDDRLEGGQGVDTFVYRTGAGRDTIVDFAAGETISVYGYTAAQSVAQSGNNVVVTFASGNQITVYNATTAAVQAALKFESGTGGGGTPGGTTPTAGDDTLTGTDSANSISGLGGNDTIYGLGGNDTLDGGAGNDTIDGGAGADMMIGGAGNDRFYVDNAGDKITEGNFSGGTDEVIALANYTLGSTAYVEKMTASGSNAFILTGNNFVQTMTGNELDNILSGLGGNDVINGGTGNDVLIGGVGADTLTGGSGSDRFVYSGGSIGSDRIADFQKGTDKIDLDAYNITMANVRISASSGNTLVAVDTNFDGQANFTITLVGTGAPDAGDFIF